MIDQIKTIMKEASETLKTQINTVGGHTKEKAYQMIEEWLLAIPILEQEGLETTSFALSIAISPSLEVELKGESRAFTVERLEKLKEKYKSKVPLQAIFTTIRTTYRMHRSINAPLKEPLVVKIKAKLTPEVSVFIGEPLIR